VGGGDPSPFIAPPEVEEKKRPMIGTPMRIVLALTALAAGIYIADMATSGTSEVVEEDAGSGAVAEGADSPGEEGSESESGADTDTEAETDSDSDPDSESEANPDSESEAEAETQAVADSDSVADTEAETVAATTASRRGSRRRSSMRSPETATSSMRSMTSPTAMEPPPSGEPGVVTIFVVGGWADIYEGSRRLGRTPARLSLPAGRHTLTLRPPEGDPVRRSVDVPAGGAARLRVEL
jgi:hypothetical protein